jgi:Phosphoenolpyruvate synthase/pyruvate phosphate dikinase
LVLTLNPSFSPLRRHIGAPLFTSVVIFEDQQGTWLFRNSEAEALGKRMIDFLSVPAHLADFEDALQASETNLKEAIKDARSTGSAPNATVAEVVLAFQELERRYYDYYRLGAFVEPVQVAAQSAIAPSLGEASTEAIFALPQESFATAITESLAQCAEASESHYKGELARHSHAFGWSQNNYARCLELSSEDVDLQIQALGDRHEAAKALRKEVSDTRDNRAALMTAKTEFLRGTTRRVAGLIALHDLIGGQLLDHRKRLVMATNGAVSLLVHSLSESLGRDHEDLLYLLPQEIPSFVERPARYDERISQRREAFLIYQADFSVLDEQALASFSISDFEPMDSPYVVEGPSEVEVILRRLSARLDILSDTSQAGDEISGTTAFAVIGEQSVRGRVRIIRDPVKDDLAEGEILVASSTTPDFMRAIQKSMAIVTDWGGETSHAAITSRELRKPCIIGTNYASNVLKNGELVELDFAKGTVRRVSESD